MPSKSITDAFVRNVKAPTTKRQATFIDTLERGLALVLVVSYGGTKTFRMLTYASGKARTKKLGSYPTLTVKEARTKAREYWEHPKKFEAEKSVGTFKEVADNWMKRYVEAHQLRSKGEIQRILDKYLYPEWEDRPFLEIRRGDVNILLDKITDRKGPQTKPVHKNQGRSQADGALAIIRGIMTWHQSRDENYVSPIVKGMRRHKSIPRTRVLDDEELRAVWSAANDIKNFGPIIKLCILTGQRSRKVASMEWHDVKDGVWTIAQGNREKGTAKILKLSPIARDIIDAQPRFASNSYIFAGWPSGHFNSWSQHKAAFDTELKKWCRKCHPGRYTICAEPLVPS